MGTDLLCVLTPSYHRQHELFCATVPIFCGIGTDWLVFTPRVYKLTLEGYDCVHQLSFQVFFFFLTFSSISTTELKPL